MIAIIGLGNPGSEYENTRHNAGFMALNEFASEFSAPEFKQEKKFNASISTITIRSEKIILVKPNTFMNLSGEAVQSLMQFYKISPENVWVIYDDIDLPLGEIRIRKTGSPGTHNGMKSIVQHIGKNFPRIRIGIESRGVTAPEQQETSSFVLSPFLKGEQSFMKKTLQKTTKAIKTALEEGTEAAMNQFN